MHYSAFFLALCWIVVNSVTNRTATWEGAFKQAAIFCPLDLGSVGCEPIKSRFHCPCKGGVVWDLKHTVCWSPWECSKVYCSSANKHFTVTVMLLYHNYLAAGAGAEVLCLTASHNVNKRWASEKSDGRAVRWIAKSEKIHWRCCIYLLLASSSCLFRVTRKQYFYSRPGQHSWLCCWWLKSLLMSAARVFLSLPHTNFIPNTMAPFSLTLVLSGTFLYQWREKGSAFTVEFLMEDEPENEVYFLRIQCLTQGKVWVISSTTTTLGTLSA